MPFGLKTATNTFQTLMAQIVLQGLLNECCLVYLDDVIIFSKNWKEHLHHLSLVLERLTIHGLACSLDKCCFAKREVQYLGLLPLFNFTSSLDPPVGSEKVCLFFNWVHFLISPLLSILP